MKYTFILITASIITLTSACKKTYTCECKNSFKTYTAGEKEGTKGQAKRYCKSLSSNDTDCYLKN